MSDRAFPEQFAPRRALSAFLFLLSLLLPILISTIADAQSYGPYPAQTYSVCRPATAPTHAAVLIHGGAWRGGNFASPQVAYLCRQLAAHGILVVSIDYRDSSLEPWPAQLLDAQMAIRWVRNQYRLPTCAVGTSAGGQIALLAGKSPALRSPAVDPNDEAAQLPRVSSVPDCIVSISAPMDLPQLLTNPRSDPRVANAINHLVDRSPLPRSTALAAASPVTPTGLGTMPPTLVMQGRSDPLIPAAQAEEFVRALAAARSGAGDVFVETPGRHVFVGLTRAEIDRYIDGIAAFIERSK